MTGAEFMSKLAPTLQSNLMRFGLSEHDAEDVVQEVFARALAYRPGFATARDFTRWATIVARNLGYDRLRELGRLDGGRFPDYALPDAAEEVERVADAEALVRAYESLSESDRRVLYEAADGIRPTSGEERKRFRVWLSRARSRLRSRLHGGLVALPARLRFAEVEHLATGFGSALLVLGLANGAVPAAPTDPTVIELLAALASGTTSTPPDNVVQGARGVPVGATSTADSQTAARAHDPTPNAGRRVTYERFELAPPGGEQLAAVDTHESANPDPPLICVWNVPVVGSKCVAK